MGDYPGSPAQQLAAAWKAATAAFGQWREEVTAATSEAVEKLDPVARAAFDAVRAAVSGNWGSCQCPCVTTHPQDKGVCDGGAVLTRRVGETDMQLCAPCAVAQGVAEMPH
jgi:hypothetical protein